MMLNIKCSSKAILVVVIFLVQKLSGNAYEYIVAASGMTGFIAWVGIAVSHYRFRRYKYTSSNQ
jgi:lysine-specific permease